MRGTRAVDLQGQGRLLTDPPISDHCTLELEIDGRGCYPTGEYSWAASFRKETEREEG